MPIGEATAPGTTEDLPPGLRRYTSAWHDEFLRDLKTLCIYDTDEQCRERNKVCLKSLRKTIYGINAEHDDKRNAESSKKSAFYCGDLEKTLFLSLGCKVMLKSNVAPHIGLYNGCVGPIIELIYENPTDCATFKLPNYIIVEFESYSGDPFFKGKGREKWVPVMPETHTINDADGTFRKQFPLCLAYAINEYQATEMAFPEQTYVDIRDKETTTPGLLSVMVLKEDDIENLRIGDAKPFERNRSLEEEDTRYRLEEQARIAQLTAETRKHFGL